MRVGFIGLGKMGAGMAGHVATSEHDVAVYDTRPEPIAQLASMGARAATSVADAASNADLVSVVVLDDAQVLDVVTRPDGALATMPAGSVLAIHSTVTLDCIRRVADAAHDVGVRVLDAGISGGVPGAAAGTLMVIVGGEADTLDAVRPGMEPWSGEIVHVGPLGAGMVAKVARNYLQYAAFGLIHEAQTFAGARDVDLGQLAHIIRATKALDLTSIVLDRTDATPRRPDELGDAGAGLIEMVHLGFKDLDVAEAIAAELGVELPGLASGRAGFGPSIGVDLQA